MTSDNGECLECHPNDGGLVQSASCRMSWELRKKNGNGKERKMDGVEAGKCVN